MLIFPVSFKELSIHVPEVQFEASTCSKDRATFLRSNSHIRLDLTSLKESLLLIFVSSLVHSTVNFGFISFYVLEVMIALWSSFSVS